MKKLILPLLLVMFSCTKTPKPNPIEVIGCSLATIAGNQLATDISAQLACTNLSAIQSDIAAALVKANVCQASAQPKVSASLASAICQQAGTFLLQSLSLGAIPASWGCSPANGPAIPNLQTIITNVCGKL